jgi:hypothetical protein
MINKIFLLIHFLNGSRDSGLGFPWKEQNFLDQNSEGAMAMKSKLAIGYAKEL